MAWRIKTLLPLLLLSINLIGCSRLIILHPVEKSDIVVMTKGNPYIPEKNGYFLSDEYMKEVIAVRVDKK